MVLIRISHGSYGPYSTCPYSTGGGIKGASTHRTNHQGVDHTPHISPKIFESKTHRIPKMAHLNGRAAIISHSLLYSLMGLPKNHGVSPKTTPRAITRQGYPKQPMVFKVVSIGLFSTKSLHATWLEITKHPRNKLVVWGSRYNIPQTLNHLGMKEVFSEGTWSKVEEKSSVRLVARSKKIHQRYGSVLRSVHKNNFKKFFCCEVAKSFS